MTLDTEQRDRLLFLRPGSLGQDAKNFRLIYSQDILGQPYLHKKENTREKKKYNYVQGTFSTICIFPEPHFFWAPPNFH